MFVLRAAWPGFLKGESPMFKGSIVALVTPFSNGKVDEAKLRELVDYHVKNGTDGISP